MEKAFFRLPTFPSHLLCFKMVSGEVPGFRWGLAFIPLFSSSTPRHSAQGQFGGGGGGVHEGGRKGRRDERGQTSLFTCGYTGLELTCASIFSELLRAQQPWIISQPCSFQTAHACFKYKGETSVVPEGLQQIKPVECQELKFGG